MKYYESPGTIRREILSPLYFLSKMYLPIVSYIHELLMLKGLSQDILVTVKVATRIIIRLALELYFRT